MIGQKTLFSSNKIIVDIVCDNGYPVITELLKRLRGEKR